MRRMREANKRPVSAQGRGPVLARGLPQVRLLRLPSGRGRVHALQEGQPPALQEGLPKVRKGAFKCFVFFYLWFSCFFILFSGVFFFFWNRCWVGIRFCVRSQGHTQVLVVLCVRACVLREIGLWKNVSVEMVADYATVTLLYVFVFLKFVYYLRK